MPVGLVYDAAGHVIPDPDAAVRGALEYLFAAFEATGSATAVVKAFRAAGLTFPWRHLKGPRKGETDWKPLAHHTVLHVLHNPRYAGAFTYGRYRHHKLPSGKWTSTILPRSEWISFIPGAHPGYITLDQYDANIAKLAANAAAHGRDRAAGPPREGAALCQGIIICGACGTRMTVRYHRRRGTDWPTYLCQRDGIQNARPICTAIPGASLDQAIGQLLLATLTPLAVEAALTVTAELEHRAAEADTLRAAHVERTRYHADLARRRYGAPRVWWRLDSPQMLLSGWAVVFHGTAAWRNHGLIIFPLLFYRTSVQLCCPAAPPGGGLRPPGRPGGVGHLLVGHPALRRGFPGLVKGDASASSPATPEAPLTWAGVPRHPSRGRRGDTRPPPHPSRPAGASLRRAGVRGGAPAGAGGARLDK